MKTISNEDKAREYCNCEQCGYDSKCVCVKFNTFMKAAQWKDEQFEKEKQQLIDRAVDWLNKYLFYLDKKDDIINNFKQLVKGE